jgi:hypothetical protein
MFVLNEKAVLTCNHPNGFLRNDPSQNFVRIQKSRVLIETEPLGWIIKSCPMVPPQAKPCTVAEKVEKGYSAWVRISGRRVCLDTVTGYTDGMAPRTIMYTVMKPGQEFVSEK